MTATKWYGNTAADAYADTRREILAALDAIQYAVDDHAEQQARDPYNWGRVGDAHATLAILQAAHRQISDNA